ncbi:hypothetical protein GCM10010160_01550 [Acrocarpospora corrugata]
MPQQSRCDVNEEAHRITACSKMSLFVVPDRGKSRFDSVAPDRGFRCCVSVAGSGTPWPLEEVQADGFYVLEIQDALVSSSLSGGCWCSWQRIPLSGITSMRTCLREQETTM